MAIPSKSDLQLASKRTALRFSLARHKTLVVAYSGGVDSAYLMHAAHETLGKGARAVIADSPSLPRRELADAVALAEERGWSFEIIRTHELENSDYAANPINRCYFCKAELFTRLSAYALREGVTVMAYGENADDVKDFRPGQQAAKEFEVLAPLRDAGLTKAEIRQLSQQAGLPTAEKPALPCLSSRIPHGQPVTVESLHRIEHGENLLRDLGFRIFRLRHDEGTARIVVGPDELPRLEDQEIRARITNGLLPLGFTDVHFEREAYQGASLR